MKIKIIEKGNTYDLEKSVNEFLSAEKEDDIIDIKYQGIGNQSAYSSDKPSVMIIMKG